MTNEGERYYWGRGVAPRKKSNANTNTTNCRYVARHRMAESEIEMTALIERILCAVLGHRYVVEIEFGTSRKVGCTRCNRHWGMHDVTRSFIPWDSELEEMYRVTGRLK